MEGNYGLSSLPSGPPPPPPSSSPPSSHIGDHIGNGSSGNNPDPNQHSSSQQQRHAKPPQARVPLVNPVAPLNTREGHMTSHQPASMPLSNAISGSSRYVT